MRKIAESFSGGIFAITLFVGDLSESEHFYGDLLGLPKAFGDEVSSIYLAGSTAINLLQKSAALDLVTPDALSEANAGVQAVYTLRVKDVDQVVEELIAAGVVPLNGPMDRPWGVRTASIVDPDGHVWEFADHA